jgi:hypothetical protein
MPARLAQQEDENSYEARAKTLVNHAVFCPWHPRVISTTYRDFLRSRSCQRGLHNKIMKMSPLRRREGVKKSSKNQKNLD